jgi:sulfate adenylyltransferase
VGLWHEDRPVALLEGARPYRYDRQELAKQVFGTEDSKHPGVANVWHMEERLLGGTLQALGDIETPFTRYRLTPWKRASCSRPKPGAPSWVFRRGTSRISGTSMCKRRL